MTDKLRQDIIAAIDESEGFIEEVGKGSGFRLQPEDSRDWTLERMLNTATKPALAAELKNLSEIRDQGQIGSCTGYAVTAAVEYLRRNDGTFWNTIYSPLFVYYNARKAIGEEKLDYGAYIRDAVKSAAHYGVAVERDWMYYEVHKTFAEEPTPRAYEGAKRWKLGGYYACNSLNNLKLAITNGYPVVGGFMCFSNISTQAVWDTGIIPLPNSVMTGGHAVMFCGYDDNRRLVKFKNSWGSYWGDDGYGYLPYDFWSRGLVMDMWALKEECDTTMYPKRSR
jgi:C1A family cysteine protease